MLFVCFIVILCFGVNAFCCLCWDGLDFCSFGFDCADVCALDGLIIVLCGGGLLAC